MRLIGLLLNLAAITATAVADIDDVKLTLVPSEETLVRYTNESLIVHCYGTSIGVELHWRSPKGEIVSEQRGRIHVEKSTKALEQLKLVFTHISLADRGEWSCEAASEGETKRQSFNLIVYEKISFTENSTIITVKEGTKATILCEVKGEPQPNVTWYFNGQPIPIDGNSAKYQLRNDGLQIYKVTQNDTGEYTCRAYQVNTIASDMQERTILLKIEHQPFWVHKEQSNESRYAYINGTATLPCEAIAEPPAKFTWYRGNHHIHNNEYYTVAVDNYVSTIHIRALDKSVFTTYKCRAENALGRITRTVKLEQGTKPPPPTALKLRGFNSNTFDVDLEAHRATKERHPMEIKSYRIEYMTDFEFKANAGNWTHAKGKDFQFEDGATYLINQLEPDTTYFMRAASRNAAGLSDWTKTEKFHTLSNEPKAAAAAMEHLTRAQLLGVTLIALVLSKELSFGFGRSDVGKFLKLEKFFGFRF